MFVAPLKNWDSLGRGYRQGDETFYNNFHLGTDLWASYQDKILAPEDGEIIISQKFTEGGNTVWYKWEHPFYGTLIQRFLHLISLPSLGKYRKGEQIGSVGNTGNVSPKPTPSKPYAGTHLHTDISLKSVNLDNKLNFINPEFIFNNINMVKQKIMVIQNYVTKENEIKQLNDAFQYASDFVAEATQGQLGLEFTIVNKSIDFVGKKVNINSGYNYDNLSGVMVDPNQVINEADKIIGNNKFDIVLLAFDLDKVNPRPTNSLHSPTYNKIYTVIQLLMLHTYDQFTLNETVLHELLHAWYWLINRRAGANLTDDVHHYSGSQDPRPEANYKRLIETLSPYYNQLTINNKKMRYVIVEKEQYLLDDTLKIALNIGDVEQLNILKVRGLNGEPEQLDNIDGYLQYPLVTKDKLKDLLGF